MVCLLLQWAVERGEHGDCPNNFTFRTEHVAMLIRIAGAKSGSDSAFSTVESVQ